MRDFTLSAYAQYLEAIVENFSNVLTCQQCMLQKDSLKDGSFCVLRHDVDRRPNNALHMARLESRLGVNSTYYFRMKPHTFKSPLIEKIEALGHEIGYHYECLAKARGDLEKAYELFRQELAEMRKFVEVNTIAMHGSAGSGIDNRDLWRDSKFRKKTFKKLNLVGEVYLDIDYSDILYLTDTGRNWHSTKNNLRDKVESNVQMDFHSGTQLLEYLKGSAHPRLILQTHPERWSNTLAGWGIDYARDKCINVLKKVLE